MEHFDKYSTRYRETLNKSISISGERSEYFAEYKARYISKSVPRDFSGKVLDFGCGVGLLSSFLRKYLPNSKIHGYDISRGSIEMIDNELASEGLFTCDNTRLDYDYNLIIVSNVLHHIQPVQRQQTIIELHKRLPPGGKLLLFEHNPLNPLTQWVVDHCEFDKDAILLSQKEASNYLVQSGLRLMRRDYIVFFPHWMSWLRPLEPLFRWCPIGAQYALVGERHD